MGGGGVEAGGKGGGKVSEEGECGSYRRAPRHKRWAGGEGSGGRDRGPIIISTPAHVQIFASSAPEMWRSALRGLCEVSGKTNQSPQEVFKRI